MKQNKICMIRTIKGKNVIAIGVVWVSCLLFWFQFLIRDSHPGRQKDGLTCCVCWFFFFFWLATNRKRNRKTQYMFFYFSVKLLFFLIHSFECFFPETIILSSASGSVYMLCDTGPETDPIASTPLSNN